MLCVLLVLLSALFFRALDIHRTVLAQTRGDTQLRLRSLQLLALKGGQAGSRAGDRPVESGNLSCQQFIKSVVHLSVCACLPCAGAHNIPYRRRSDLKDVPERGPPSASKGPSLTPPRRPQTHVGKDPQDDQRLISKVVIASLMCITLLARLGAPSPPWDALRPGQEHQASLGAAATQCWMLNAGC